MISNSSFKNVKDIVCGNIGDWEHNGSPLKYSVMKTYFGYNDLRLKAMMKNQGCYIFKLIHNQNIQRQGFRKILVGINSANIDVVIESKPFLTKREVVLTTLKRHYYSDVFRTLLRHHLIFLWKIELKTPKRRPNYLEELSWTKKCLKYLKLQTHKHSRKFLIFFLVRTATSGNDILNTENCYFTVRSSRRENLCSNSCSANF